MIGVMQYLAGYLDHASTYPPKAHWLSNGHRHNEARFINLYRTHLVFTFTDPLVKDLRLGLGCISLKVAGHFRMSMAVKPAQEPRLQYGLAIHLAKVTTAWRCTARSRVLLRLAVEATGFCTGIEVAPLTLYLKCDDGAHLMLDWRCTSVVPPGLCCEPEPRVMHHLWDTCESCKAALQRSMTCACATP